MRTRTKPHRGHLSKVTKPARKLASSSSSLISRSSSAEVMVNFRDTHALFGLTILLVSATQELIFLPREMQESLTDLSTGCKDQNLVACWQPSEVIRFHSRRSHLDYRSDFCVRVQYACFAGCFHRRKTSKLYPPRLFRCVLLSSWLVAKWVEFITM